MIARTTAYDRRFYSAEAEGIRDSACRIIPWLMQLGPSVRSVVDVGCGIAIWLAAVADEGIDDYLGIDGDYVDPEALRIPKEHFLASDLLHPVEVDRRFDLVMSLEVAEHLPPDAADPFVRELTGLGDFVLFSAAVPGQGGTNHVNEQWPSYWVERFKAREFECFDYVRPVFWDDATIERWYRQNLLLFARGEVKDILQGLPLAEFPQRDVIHPDVFKYKVENSVPAYPKHLLRATPRALMSAAERRIRR